MKDHATGKKITSATVIEEARKESVNAIIDALDTESFEKPDIDDVLHRVKARLEKIYGQRFS